MTRYTLTYIHLLCYTTTFWIATYLFFMYETYKPILSIVVGWSLFGLGTIGHDAHHNSFSNNKTINKIVGFLFLDMILFSSKDWLYLHNEVHHKYLLDTRDIMSLNGRNFIYEFISVVYIHKTIEKQEKNIVKHHIPKLLFYYYLYLLGIINSCILVLSYMFCISYLTYITHSYRKQSLHKPTSHEFHLDNTWDVYPKSHIVSLITGGINAHATHHIYPNATRSEQFLLCDKIQLKYQGYRRINTLTQLHCLFWNRGAIYTER